MMVQCSICYSITDHIVSGNVATCKWCGTDTKNPKAVKPLSDLAQLSMDELVEWVIENQHKYDLVRK